ncbi:thrombospondin type-1 domain-containing protein 4-like isoform X2 [Ostrea edulis]|uniref:thrombospondin type-1 domain-containing protein 4-like isoform X2 n=1 Tax=Ostrea edulis TaxID=37623 RepID=UPI0024AFD16C|nr:thrombospondin type-1 domain-containing protein 4-like isoform X2 [Ostrea edulis]
MSEGDCLSVWKLLALFTILLKFSFAQRSWTEWSSCTATCGPGVQHRYLHCLPNTNHCYGNQKQYKVCNIKACQGKNHDYRSTECRKHNSKKYRGRLFQWEKFILPSRRCSLVCRAAYYGFYATFSGQVRDGTLCDDKSTDRVCILGKCVTVGCDGIVGSGAVVDRCGVCAGKNRDCQTISGIYTRASLPFGYTLITRIPEGACSINITELGTSRNYLALRLQNGSYITNGHHRLSRVGDYTAAGTTFTYRKREGTGCPGECVSAKGPVNQTIDVQLLYYRKSPGILYQFTIPKHMTKAAMEAIIPRLKIENQFNQDVEQPVADSSGQPVYETGYENIPTGSGGYPLPKGYRPKIIPNRRTSAQSPPRYIPFTGGKPELQSLTINGRGQARNLTESQYRLYSSYYGPHNSNQAVSGDYGRRYATYPRSEAQRNSIRQGNSLRYNSVVDNTLPRLSAQNIPDASNYEWRIIGFTECSLTCGRGVQQTKVVCVNKDQNLIVTDDNCVPNDRPASQTVECNTRICPPGWDIGNWSDCSVSCGRGMHTRPVVCAQRVSSTSRIDLQPSRCPSPRPESSRTCMNRQCAEWKIGKWEKCSSVCGKGQRKRLVVCHSIEGQNVTDNQCEGRKPLDTQICDMGSCAQGWFHSQWSRKCFPSCGQGHRSRTVYCSTPDGAEVSEAKCQARKPKKRKSCRNKRPCGGYWFAGPWSECTSTCGSGVQERYVICVKKLDKKLFTIVGKENCRGRDKPETKRACGELPPCQPEWFMTPWSKCSASCGTGTKTREIRCMDADIAPSSTCSVDKKPSQQNICNTQPCPDESIQQDPSCKDLYKFCRLAGPARLCSYPFYQEKCCSSCQAYQHRKTKQKP